MAAHEPVTRITKSSLVELFKALGFKQAAKWSDKVFCMNIENIAELSVEMAERLDESMAAVLSTLISTVTRGEYIEIINDHENIEIECPTIESDLIRKEPRKPPKIKISRGSKGFRVLSAPSTRAIHWMVKEGFSDEEIIKVLKHFEIYSKMKPTSIKCSIAVGRGSSWSNPAPFSEDEIQQLYNIIGRKRDAKETKSEVVAGRDSGAPAAPGMESERD